MTSSVERARTAFARQDWKEAFTAFTSAGVRTSLGAAEHERLAICAYLLGKDEECTEAWEAAYRAALEAGEPADAARSAFWLALCLMVQGRMAQAGGWFARAERLIAGLDCPAAGYLLIPALLAALEAGDPATARDLGVEASELGSRFGDADLRAFGTLGHGQALIAEGDVTGGKARLDEVMVGVRAGEVGPIASGIVYCAVILECMQLFDFRRASEWTDALSDWCDAQPDLVPYRGQCLVHQSQLKQASGDWRDALTAAEAACHRLEDPPHPALGIAYYQQGDLHRLVGNFQTADERYREASRHGYQPMPGLALLMLARGDAAAAAATIQRALQEPGHPLTRTASLFAAVDILRAAGDLAGARAAAEELAVIATASSADVIVAMAAHARGTVLLGEGDPVAALAELRVATATWRSLHMPYEAAGACVLVGLACAALGDRTSAALELDNARDTFDALGAMPDLDRVSRLTSGLTEGAGARSSTGAAATLSARERQVLAHLASGRTNREIATSLVISQHTVGRHVENIFTKLGVSSRAAATAYAYEHDLV